MMASVRSKHVVLYNKQS